MEIKNMYDLTGFQRDLLHIIAGSDEPHGLAVKASVDEYYDEEINHGRLYPNLDTLVEKGLIEKQARDRRTNEYILTIKGEDMIRSRREWEDNLADELQDNQSQPVV